MSHEILCSTDVPRIPLVLHVPHSSTYIPESVRQSFLLDTESLNRELLRMTDWYTDHLFSHVVEIGGAMFVNRTSRLVVDPERFRRDADEVMASRGMGVIYTHTSDGLPLRLPLTEGERERLLISRYTHYAQALTRLVRETVRVHGRCLILDGHSYSSQALPYELDQAAVRPAICIGTDWFHTPSRLVDDLVNFCQSHGFECHQNTPFSGTYVPSQLFHRDARVASLMLEIRRDLYMDEQTGHRSDTFMDVWRLIDKLIELAGSTAYSCPVICPSSETWSQVYQSLVNARANRPEVAIPEPPEPDNQPHVGWPIGAPLIVPWVMNAAIDNDRRQRWGATLDWAREHRLYHCIRMLEPDQVVCV